MQRKADNEEPRPGQGVAGALKLCRLRLTFVGVQGARARRSLRIAPVVVHDCAILWPKKVDAWVGTVGGADAGEARE